ncbi:MAG TPA: nuclear transport factor 2 family protein [Sphingopyxis sp.]|nr:nuclear transport factor 2 family protein [Sphingopyxis sp.]
MSDEEAIRTLIETWLIATRRGEIERLQPLLAEDVAFLQPGRAPMGREEFLSLARAQSGDAGPSIETRGEIRDMRVCGDFAYTSVWLEVTVTPRGATPITRSGYTLSVFQKQRGQWRLLRDANLLTPNPPAA